MSRDQLAGLATLILGVALASLGAWAYAGKGAEKFFRNSWAVGGWFFGPGTTLFLLPAGIGFTFFGIAGLIGKNVISTGLVVVGVAAVLVGWLLFFIHPNWIRPRWMRSTLTGRSAHGR